MKCVSVTGIFFLSQEMSSCDSIFLPVILNFSCDKKFLLVTRNIFMWQEMASLCILQINILKMATKINNNETICRHNKYGHCKYGETCRHYHVNEICERSKCKIFRCEKRHPRECKYWREYKICKFNEFCSYK